jgi:N-formylglutamate amidohydrolase
MNAWLRVGIVVGLLGAGGTGVCRGAAPADRPAPPRAGAADQVGGTASAAAVLGSGAPDSAVPAELLRLERGELPIVISAPHGGTRDIPGSAPRRGAGLERRPGGFVVARDGGTEELAGLVAAALAERLGARPWVVVNRAHRRFMDPNRRPEEAFEDAAAERVYRRYHAFLTEACTTMRQRHGAGLVIDFHGQGSAAGTVFRGTGNGLSTESLVRRFGPRAVVGAESLGGELRQRGVLVHPGPLDGPEQAGFTGGFITKHYGAAGGFDVAAVQLEFGASYRKEEARDGVAAVVADAIAAHAVNFLGCKAASGAARP